ncbi:M20 metallopeptidase family protein [Salirhabdus salicampi]|uniref:M20 metallopeptidase family protein n=1 Tax=Salirhabdus salicampi TaxID=476102 RepID=UPI0020C28485|nr:M20 family metallopeptidase [Salirhabdus salicampi]MCP8617707.1 M20 family metallopeptidase [Salirhabdus salicampi]
MTNLHYTLKDHVKHMRRALHQFPELSFQEYKTTEFIIGELKNIPGMKVYTGRDYVGLETGVIGVLSTGDGPVIGIRADIDALPIQEQNDIPYRSKCDGVMHACGHDAHTAMALGAAALLAEQLRKGEWKGTIKFIFQPAEEDTDENGSTGAPYLIDAGILHHVDAVIALHVHPDLPAGEILLNKEYTMAGIDTFDAKILGTGGHAAYPHTTNDPIWMLGTVLQNLQGIVARKTSPMDPSVISVTHVQTNPSYNVIPDSVSLKGTLRSYHPTNRQQLRELLETSLTWTRTVGGDYTLNIIKGEPPLYNDPQITKVFEETIQNIFPNFLIHNGPFGMGGEDFAHMTNQVPGAMFFLGAKVMDEKERGLHTPHFDIDETALLYGVTILAETAVRLLKTA